MKRVVIILGIVLSANLVASEILIEHPCNTQPILKTTLPHSKLQESVFAQTSQLLKINNIESELGDNGIKSILNYVQEDKAIEVISHSKMRAYGWCYSINGFIPDVMPDQVEVKATDTIKWFLSYSTFDNGQWVDYCMPVTGNSDSQNFICK